MRRGNKIRQACAWFFCSFDISTRYSSAVRETKSAALMMDISIRLRGTGERIAGDNMSGFADHGALDYLVVVGTASTFNRQ